MEIVGAGVDSILTGVSAAGIIGGLGILLNFILRNKSGDRDGWGALFKGLSERVAALEAECTKLRIEVNACREREGEWMRRAITAEAALMGKGDALNEAQRMLSSEREADAAKRGKNGDTDG